MAGEIGVLRLELSGEQLDELAGRIVEKLGADSRKREAPPKLLLTPDELCATVGVGRFKLDELVKKGLPQRRLGAQTPRYKLADVEAWLDAHPDLLAEDGTD